MKLKEIAENHGLTPEGVDYALTQYQIVICEITHGMMSKLSYDAHDIIRTAQERWCDTCELKKEQEPIEPHWRCPTVYMNGTGKIELICGNCGISIPLGKPNYCPWCGRKIKWNNKENEYGT